MNRIWVVLLLIAACGGGNEDTSSADAVVDAPIPGKFASPVAYPTCVHVVGGNCNPTSVALADLNGDGKTDLAVSNNGDFSNSVLLNTGAGTFGMANEWDVGNVFALTLGDVNADGKPDLVDSYQARLNNGDGTFAAPTAGAGHGAGGFALKLADLNGDAKLDLVAANTSTRRRAQERRQLRARRRALPPLWPDLAAIARHHRPGRGSHCQLSPHRSGRARATSPGAATARREVDDVRAVDGLGLGPARRRRERV